jgi:hypothetical protein
MLDIADPGRYRQPGGEAENEEETDSDPEHPKSSGRSRGDEGQQGDGDERSDDTYPQVILPAHDPGAADRLARVTLTTARLCQPLDIHGEKPRWGPTRFSH